MAAETAATRFDPVRYKQVTEQQWQQAARAWNEWTPFLREWLGPATELMLDGAGVTAGARVLDVAAGAGDQSLRAAQRVGPRGHVLATDISSNLLEYAAMNARAVGVTQLQVRKMDGENLEVPEESFDSVISRVGLIYFPDRSKALRGIRTALRRGGRVGVIVYSTPEANRFFSIPVGIIRRRAGLPPPPAGQPGPFSLGAPGALATAFAEAGFREIEVTAIDAPLRMSSAEECVRFEKESFGALHGMMAALDETERTGIWDEIRSELRRFESGGAFRGPCELLVGTAAR